MNITNNNSSDDADKTSVLVDDDTNILAGLSTSNTTLTTSSSYAVPITLLEDNKQQQQREEASFDEEPDTDMHIYSVLHARDEELAATRRELESLKKDASLLRDQLLIQKEQQQFQLHTTKHSPRHPHTRTISAPFIPSPLRHASFPPYPTMPNTPPSNPSHILVSRLRQERDDALSRLSYCELEHALAVDSLQSEIRELRKGRDVLKQDLSDMVHQMIEGEKAIEQLAHKSDIQAQADLEYQALQSQLTETLAELQSMKEAAANPHRDTKSIQEIALLTDTLCQAEASEQQAKSRLNSALAELDRLRTRYESDSVESGQIRTLLDVEKDTDIHAECHNSLQELRQENMQLLDDLEAANDKYNGASNLALTLQQRLDDETDKLTTLQDLNQQVVNQVSSLEVQAKKDEATMEIARAEIISQKAGLEQQVTETMEEKRILKAALHQVRLERDGAANRALALQQQLDAASDRYLQAETRLVQVQTAGDNIETRYSHKMKDLDRITQELMTTKGELQTAESVFQDMLRVFLQYRKKARSAIAEAKTESKSQVLSPSPSGVDVANMILVLAQASKGMAAHRTVSEHREQSLRRLAAQVEDLESAKADLQLQLTTRLAVCKDQDAEKLSLREKITTLERDVSSLRKTNHLLADEAATSQNRVRTLESDLQLQTAETAHVTAKLQSVEKELEHVRESLRVAEEEGRNLVADFNMLSEELEKRQQEDDNRSPHTDDTVKQLAAAESRHLQLLQKTAQDEAAMTELSARLTDLEHELEAMQTAVEETDDKYLASLKTIKKQSLALDKLKVRNEALSRANTLLSQALPSSGSSLLAPAPSSAKKRGLPADFVAPDPGPQAVVMSFKSRPNPSQLENSSLQPTVPADKIPVASLQQKRALESKQTVPLQTSRPAGLQTKPLPSRAARTPLAALPPQVSEMRSITGGGPAIKETERSKTGLGNKPLFKPSVGLGNRVQSTHAAAPASDTRSLLAALHALKKP